MGASSDALAGVGISPEPAKLLGEQITQNLAGVGTAAVGATVLSGTVNTLTTAGGATAFILKNHNAGRTTEAYNTTSTAALIFPPTGGAIDGGSTDASVSVAQNKGRIFRYITPLIIKSILSA